MRASLLLEDGTFVTGRAYGKRCERMGEVVFNTAMTGYEEVLSDPSYTGQFVLFTASHIGNTGMTSDDMESRVMAAEGFICKDFSQLADNHRSRLSLEAFLEQQGRCVLSGVDTRFLAKQVRNKGCMKAILSTEDHNPESLKTKLLSAIDISARDVVTAARQTSFTSPRTAVASGKSRFKIVAVDCGMKRGILDDLEGCGIDVHVVGPNATFLEIEAIHPDGLFVGNGPGCPKQLAGSSRVLHLIRELSARLPTFGICLGHQLIALAYGGETRKLSFGHHAVNHPIVSEVELAGLPRGLVMMTSQNHNYHVVEKSIENDFVVTHRHMNDGTVAGMMHKSHPVFSVQFHPECNPGPRDAKNLFSVFLKMLEDNAHARQN
ncbi:MAG: hypothetical protein RI953_780 [Pseudomonadota bacterium]|jgi:carbamoyl-phosphate synthase small subunit